MRTAYRLFALMFAPVLLVGAVAAICRVWYDAGRDLVLERR